MTIAADHARAYALVDDLLGPSDQVADRAVAVLHAHAAALAGRGSVTRRTATPLPRAWPPFLASTAERLRTGEDGRPVAVLG